MSIQEWLNFFQKHSTVSVFHINHLKLLTSLNDHALRISLYRLGKRNTITRICRGFYANPFNMPTLEEISAKIYQPSYISLETALASYGILSQIPQVVTCVTTQLPRTCKTTFGTIAYRQIKQTYFWGFVQKKNYCIAEKEKAIADYVYFSTRKNRRQRLALLRLEGINRNKLQRYLRNTGQPRVALD